MKAFIKFVLTSAGMVLILLGVGFLRVFTQAQTYVTDRVGEVVTETFGADCRVGAVSLDPTRRALVLEEFAILNPPAFKEGEALTSSRVRLKFSPRTLVSDEAVIERIDLEDTKVLFRHELGRGTNIGAIAERLQSQPGGGMRVRVERLVSEGGQAYVDTNLAPGGGVPINMVRIELENLESGEAITPAKVTSIFLLSVLKDVVTLKGVASSIVGRITEDVDGLEAN